MVSDAFDSKKKKRNRNRNRKSKNGNNVEATIEIDIASMNSTKRRKKKKQLNDRLKQIGQIKEKQQNGLALKQNEIDLLNRENVILSQLKQFADYQNKNNNNEN